MVITPGMMKTLKKASSENNANNKNSTTENGVYGFGQFINDVSGQNAAIDRQYNNNVNIAKHQYQWAVEDMERAGLNPAMMFGGGSGHTASTSVSQGSGSLGNVASAINSTTNLIKSFNNDDDKSNNANVAQIIDLIKLFV